MTANGNRPVPLSGTATAFEFLPVLNVCSSQPILEGVADPERHRVFVFRSLSGKQKIIKARRSLRLCGERGGNDAWGEEDEFS